jgi:hypothetical protein
MGGGGVTTLDDLDLFTPSSETVVPTPRKCRHIRTWRTFEPLPADQQVPGQPLKGVSVCGQCGHRFDPELQRRGRNARYNGKRKERVEMRRAGVHTGNANKADDGQSVDGMFAYQSKARATAAFPGWQAFELDKLRVAHQGKVPVLVLIELPGRGNKPRKLAVLEWQDWLDLHGPQS